MSNETLSLKEKSEGSSTWSQLLKLRPLAETFITCTVGNGENCSFWFDQWTPYGKLISFIGQGGPRIYGIPIDSIVSVVGTQTGWNIRGARSENMLLLLSHLTTVVFSVNTKDRYRWREGSGPQKDEFKFSLAKMQLADPFVEVQWHKEVWFSGHIPKHAFILWIVCLDRLTTKAKLRAWGIVEDSTCVLCEIYDETRDHLFLNCPYSQDVWRMAFRSLQAPFMGFGTWEVFLRWLKRPYPNPAENNMRLLMAQQIIYDLWRQRNDRIFNNTSLPAETLFLKVDRGIRNSCFAHRDRPAFKDSLALWFRGSLSSL